MTRSLSLPARLVGLVLVVVAVPLGLIGYWLAGTAARSGEELLRSRLQRTNASVAAELGGHWLGTRSVLLSFGEVAAAALGARPSETSPAVAAPPEVRAAFEALPPSVLELTIRSSDLGVRWELTRAGAPEQTFVAEIPLFSRGGERRGTLDARLRASAVLGPQGASSGASAAVVAVIDPVSSVSLRPLPLDPRVLADERFEWGGERWVAERRLLADPPLAVVSAAPLGEFAAPFEAAASRGITLLVAVAIVATLLAALLTRRMTRSLGELAEAADAVRRGELAVRVPARGRDEVGRVAEAFNAMTESLRRTLAELSRREALARVGSFAAELAHEVRNPLTSIKIDLQHVEEQLQEGSHLREVQRGALERVDRLDRTVAGVLQVARSGHVTFASLDLAGPLRAAVHAVEPSVDLAGATVRVDIGACPLRVHGDASALQQLLTNLLANASQAVGRGGSIEVHAWSEAEQVAVAIRDDGCGIPSEQLSRIREPFYSTRGDGTGLGLAIADRIAAAHRAEIRIESTVGQGTSVEVRFARAESSRSDAPG